MAIVKAVEKEIKSHEYVYSSLSYILSPENKSGDEKCFQSTTLNCFGSGADDFSKQFFIVRDAFNKDKNILAHHYIQSFSPNEKISPALAHKIGVELAQKVATGFQVVIATHVDREHIHNHIIINSVNMETGLKWKGNADTLKNMRNESDKLCKENCLTVIEKPSGFRSIDQDTLELARKGKSWKVDLCNALEESSEMCITKSDFISYMKNKGFEIIRYGEKDLTFQKIGETKKIRASTLAKQFGAVYRKENLEKKMGFYRSFDISSADTTKKKKAQSPFISEFERYEKKYFSKNLSLVQKNEALYMQKHIKASENPFLTLLAIIFRILVRRKRRNMLDKKYDLLHLYSKKQKRHKRYVPSLAEQVRKIEKMQRNAGNIPYQRLISSQGENYVVRLALSAVPKLYTYGFFFSVRIYKDYAMVTVKERDKYILQKALRVDDIKILERHNKLHKPYSDYEQMKKKAKQLKSKIEYLLIEPKQLELLKNETDRFVKFRANEKIRLVFLEENKDFILHALYPDKYPDKNNILGTPNAKVQTKRKTDWFLLKSYSYRTITQDKVNKSEKKPSVTLNQPERAENTPDKNENVQKSPPTYIPRRRR